MIKLGDFGISRILSSTQSRAQTFVGTPYYLSPEIMQKNEYSFEADIWALGCLLYEMAALQVPFNGSTYIKLYKRVWSGKFKSLPDHFSPALTQMVKKMLNVDQKKRPRINEILKWPEIEKRIGIFLADDAYKIEFAHTVMHGLNLFAEFKKSRPKKEEAEGQPDEVKKEFKEMLNNNEDFNNKYKEF